GHQFRNSAVNKMRDKQAVIFGQRQIVDTGAHCRDYALRPALQIEFQYLARPPLSRNESTRAVELDRSGHGEIPGEPLRSTSTWRDPPDFVGANRGKIE